ncbi:response regulator transcription factor [Nakamurella deserti]|uniref:response regulator transcription factor n=1 Tax=Nakamurella deserti TaxID=2164074 RepID=UPI000DBE9A78|nr:LuxR C-terminal-related transcriptional regulator [Nakamurella deserti]
MTDVAGRPEPAGTTTAGARPHPPSVRLVGAPGPWSDRVRSVLRDGGVAVAAPDRRGRPGAVDLTVILWAGEGAPGDPVLSGLPALIDAVLADGSGGRVVLLTPPVAVTPDALLAAVTAGADGWLTTDLPADALRRSLVAVAAGEPGLARHHVAHLITALRRSSPRTVLRSDGVAVDLTDRELDVLSALAAAPTTRAVADRLVVSEGTVRWHIAQLLRKLQLPARQDLIALAVARAGARGAGDSPPPGPPVIPTPRTAPDRARPAPADDAAFAAGWPRLTDGERRTVELVARGLTNAEIAATGGVSRHTVDSRVKRAFGKLGVRSRVELTRGLLGAGSDPRPAAGPDRRGDGPAAGP